jgi:hypothetical protein
MSFYRLFLFAIYFNVGLVLISLFVQASAADDGRSDRTFYDGMGRMTGTAATSGNVTTFRDAMGRMTGTATRLPDGRTEFRDAQGRLTGTRSK